MAEQQSEQQPAIPAGTEPNPNGGKRKGALLIIASVFIIITVLYLLYYFLIKQYAEGTDDSYVHGNLV